jgi:hypothetical protein
MNKKGFLALTIGLMIVLSAGASAKKILFYEVGTGGDYTIEAGYSSFKQELQSRGHDVASITQQGSLTKEKLQAYDVLVIPELGKEFTIEDISALLWFVMQKGGGLFISGGRPESANKLTIPFGTTIDTGLLKDITSPLKDDPSTNNFLITQFPSEDEYRVLRQGVNRVGFYQGSGMFLSGNAHCIASGDSDTFSDTGSFATESKPCVASAVLFGNGLVFILSDADMLSNKNIDSYDNKVFGLNIMDWISMTRELPTPGNTTQEIGVIIAALNLENKRLQAQVEQVTKEKNYMEDMVSSLNSQLTDATDRIMQMENERIGPLTKTNWVVVGFGFCILGAAIIISRKKEKAPPQETSELSYELGEELGDLGDLKAPKK